jgi:hypothetical protein
MIGRLFCPLFHQNLVIMTKTSFALSFLFFAFAMPCLVAQGFDVYISDAGNFNNPPWQILKFDENGENGTVFIDDHLGWPQDILFLESDTTVLVTNLNTGTISKFHANTGEFISEFATGISGPTRMKIGPDGLLYVLQWQPITKVRRYQLDGTSAGDFTQTTTGSAIGLDWDTAGNLYVSSYYGKYVRKYGPTGEDLGNFISANLVGPTNIWFAENGDLLVMDYLGNSVKRFDSQGNYLGVFITGLPQGEGVDFLANSNLVIGCGGTSSVRVYAPDGMFIEDFVPSATLGLLTPNAVVLRPKSLPPSPVHEAYKAVNFVTPSIGTVFEVKSPAEKSLPVRCEVFDTSGVLVKSFSFADSTTWDASGMPNGFYYLTVKLSNGTAVRQRVVVQQ